MKKFLAFMMAVLLLVGCVACTPKQEEASDLKYIQDKGTLVVGITDFEPMDFKGEDGEWTGFDAELAKLVGKELGVEVQFQEINWKMKETELASKTIDCIWNGLTWDEDRAKEMPWPDYNKKIRQVVVVKADKAGTLNTVEALKSASVAAESGSAGESFITENLADATYIEKDAQIDVLTELISGTVDAGVIDYIMAYYLINKPGSSFAGLKILDNVIKSNDEYYSIAFRKGSDVTAKVNDVLKTMKADGKIDTLAEKYALKDAIVK